MKAIISPVIHGHCFLRTLFVLYGACLLTTLINLDHTIYPKLHRHPGGGGTQIWFRRGCAAEAAKPVPIFKGHFGGKGYPLLRVFSQENDMFLCTLATKWAKISSIYSKITKVGGMFKDFQLKTIPYV